MYINCMHAWVDNSVQHVHHCGYYRSHLGFGGEALALHEKKVAEQEKNLALVEIERLKALLAQKE